MRRRPLAAFAVALALGACRPPPPAAPAASGDTATLDARLQRVETRLDELAAALSTSPGAAALPADARLARVEHQLDKLTGFLKRAVPPTLDENQVYAVPIDPRDPTLGPADAAVTMIEAYEFLCPYCAMVAPTIDQLRARYPKELRVVTKYFVIHGEPAMPAGLAACAAARQGKFGPMQAALWKTIWPSDGQAADRDQATTAAIEATAKAAGVDVKKLQTDIAGTCRTWLDDSAATLQKFGAGGTPTFWINGRPIQSTNVDAFAEAIDAELARVRASGVAPGAYYQKVVLAKGAPEAVMISPFD